MHAVDSESLNAKLEHLRHLGVQDLQPEWQRLFGSAPPKNARREYLLRAIAHHLQSVARGALPKAMRRKLIKLAQQAQPDPIKISSHATRSLKPGARIFREWQGAVHEVEVIGNGYRYRGTVYKSLSIIARQITGTRWSGPAFFGLKGEASSEVQHGR